VREEKNTKIAESTLQRDERYSSDDDAASVDTVTHVDYDDMLDVSVAAWTVEIQRDEVEKWSSREKIDDAMQSAATTTGVAPTRAARVGVCVVRVVWCGAVWCAVAWLYRPDLSAEWGPARRRVHSGQFKKFLLTGGETRTHDAKSTHHTRASSRQRRHRSIEGH
jgi:hypothetical protein